MGNNYFISAFGTFGNPNGFQQSYLLSDVITNIAKNIKTFDLNTNAIKLFPDTKIYAIRKEVADNHNIISYAVYSYAKEPDSDRSGTFIGSSFLFIDKFAEENIVIRNLNDFQNSLVDKNIDNNTIIVSHSKDLILTKPVDFDKIDFHLKSAKNLDFNLGSNKNLVVFCRTNSKILESFFKKSVDLLDIYDAIYFTDSKEIAEFVRQKRIFIAVDEGNFENEIQKLKEEKKRRIQEAVDEFSHEKLKLEDSRKKTYEEFKSQLDRNREQHLQNEKIIGAAEKDMHKINGFYGDFCREIDELSNQLKSGSKKLNEVKQIYNENKKVFRENIGNLTKVNFINTFSQPRPKADIRETFHPSHSWDNQLDNNRNKDARESKKGDKLIVFKALSLVLFAFWIVTLAYFLLFNKPNKQTVIISEPEVPTEQVEQNTAPKIKKELAPTPNSELTEKDYKVVAKKVRIDMPIEEIVQIIFKANPTDINSFYVQQLDEYAIELINRNKICFSEKNQRYFFVTDTLRHIPSYKNK